MTSYSKEVIADLVAGTLPWPQTRRIMSAYKDDDRFFKYVSVLQDRVGWSDPILLPVGDHLFICQSGDERVTKCECGHSFGDYRKNWKLKAAIIVRDSEETLREIYPNSDLPDPDWMEIREFICPECGTLHEVEAAAPGYPIVHDFEPDLEGFYRDWLGKPLEPSNKGG
ncbi:acetone carboxylase subunit gamma [Mesorhizobium sp. ESP-6-4]|uniref:acetone carboxylase subunit gamma n=1 Tax=unclassified Mesorhizobium TaxID=325217 RepID=UPI000BAFCA87|nr:MULTISPECIES: acetone carboxylase subunit gamma [unclassified Mesorhizobium]MBZ9657563.1 acetone carboxylase subunit gamma [Mesorhizobium sp. ESP-6-4]MBZ9765371.1 acetone carboxylase subunit gamma [Mesorhizobium sp. CA6]MBZ9841435.1 acetone carboxylase subunit gamma [Mesorhizobium sp. CA5]MBZ9864666.1 acetone carboxylase subunit gamma [Mesorhizobium sp. CA15]MBZ9883633.1 acetone carboxylase subunit gamma [Mesorhizobium sp. CA10]